LEQDCSKSQKQIIVNADDFGMAKGINYGIVKCIQYGIVKSVSVITNTPAFIDAIKRIRKFPKVSIGIHLNLLRGKPVLPSHDVSTLINREKNLYTLYTFVKKVFLKQIDLTQIELELSAQVEKVLQAGIKITHLDTHRHIHILPEILKIIIKIAYKYNITKIRCPLDRLNLSINYKTLLLNMFAKKAYQELRIKGFSFPDYYCDFVHIERSPDFKCLSQILRKMKTGVLELCCHPGFISNDMDSSENIIYNRERQVQLLTDKKIIDLINRFGVQLISYHDL
jgi:predicted glycoside hydrolase/deacetylase ChbG (UPF0249 family)